MAHISGFAKAVTPFGGFQVHRPPNPPGPGGRVMDVPMFDIPAPACVRCGRDKDTPATFDVCGACLHLDHRVPVPGACSWCSASSVGRDAGTAGGQAAADADPEFAHACQKALAVVRDRRAPFTAADVRAVLEEWDVTITRPAAIGSAFTSAANAGVIRATGNFIPSPVRGQHGRPLREWVAA
jgi:hypothetical protein